MTTDVTLLAALITGLLGSVHCVGMCGGIVGTLSAGHSPNQKNNAHSTFRFTLLYNLGRLSSYVVAGIIVGGFGEIASSSFNQDAQQTGIWLSSAFMILLGLYITGWWQILSSLERVGGHLWRLLQPIGNKLLPVKTYRQSFLLGALWGWLPCGMVYTMLVFSLSSQDSIQGGLIMLAFGLGTLPMLLLMGVSAAKMKRFVHQSIVRQLVGSIIILFGLYGFTSPDTHSSHSASHHSNPTLSIMRV